MSKNRYYKVTKEDEIIGVIVGEKLEENYKIIDQSSIFGLPLKLLFYKKTPVDRDEFIDIMKNFELGKAPLEIKGNQVNL